MACFTYADLPREDLAAGHEIRVDLTGDGRTALAGRLGPQVRSVTGRLVSSDSSSITVALTKTSLLTGDDNVWHGEQATIADRYINHTAMRKLSTPKTIGLVALFGGAVAGVVVLAARSGTSSSVSSVGGRGAQ